MERQESLAKASGRLLQRLSELETENKLLADNLRKSEERFRLIAETIDETFWILDLEKEAATYLSPAHERIWGYPRDYFNNSQMPFFNAIHPDDRERVTAAAALVKAGQQLDFEHRIILPDGSIRHLWSRGFPIASENGQIGRYVGVSQDITAWRSAETALKESGENLNKIINCIGDPIFVKDRKHRIVLINDAWCAFAGKRREEIVGKLGFELMSKEQAASFWEQEESVFLTGSECVTENSLTDWRGNTRTVMTKTALLADKNAGKQIVGVIRDITEYKRLEAQFLQAQKMEAVGSLAGGVAHDFNNLLNVINGYSELLLHNLAQNHPMRRDIEQVREAGLQAASLTSQLLAFSRKQILNPEVLDLNAVISGMSKMLRRLIGEDINLVTTARPGLGLVNADPGQIQQIVMNLAVNARDAMPRGGKLTIETANVDFDEAYIGRHPPAAKGPYVMLAISDNGIGMDAATQSHLFEPFFTTKGKGKGTGLGLSTVYGIVKQSNGFIWVYSERGKGTTFKIYFPCTEGKIAHSGSKSASELKSRGFETVLIAEDETSVRTLTCRILRDRGYNVLEAADGTEALRIAQEFPGEIQLVVTDVVMPGMSGKDLVSQLETARQGIKALYISGYTDDTIVHHGILDSNVAFLQKPFTVENLARKIREVISRNR